MAYRFVALEDIPALGLRTDDALTYDPGNPAEPFLLHRAVAVDPGALLAALEDGALDGQMPPQLLPATPATGLAHRPTPHITRHRMHPQTGDPAGPPPDAPRVLRLLPRRGASRRP